ncbi:hypothetical protein KUF54_06790 [Comamonas sp. Y33R10-2]|uniref:hypothetical protein n=1 Tax=Comamonas sp. Y33R10-2 TaxID=2853257 RepID=UPI001C5C9AFB|nr:hypothetical protein [Comamonas sp. Y33R10-2]QXZ10899.1 hypothetical protein KUF54_06790 [Comamonas sp. Y33R10-2]
MGFATSLQSLTRLSLKVLPFASATSLSFESSNSKSIKSSETTESEPASFIPSSFETEEFKLTHTSIPFMRANRSRRRSSNSINTGARVNSKAKANAAHIAATQLPLALPAQAGPAPVLSATAASTAASGQVKILQREPRKQPECMYISGRMADVCAALERMALNEQALQA